MLTSPSFSRPNPSENSTFNVNRQVEEETYQGHSVKEGKKGKTSHSGLLNKTDVKTVEDIVKMLDKVELGENQLLRYLIDGKNIEAANMRKELENIKEHFKICCHVVINEMHQEDMEDLNKSMILELQEHFDFWNRQFNRVQEEAVKAINQLNDNQGVDKVAFHELQNQLHSLMPKSMKEIEENKEIEEQLINMNM